MIECCISFQTKGRVTFSNRIVSAVTDSRVESGRASRKTLVPSVNSELRPNTSQTLQRVSKVILFLRSMID